MTISNSMISGNDRDGIDTGGGATVVFSTISGNGSSGMRGGGQRGATVKNTILANNSFGNCLLNGIGTSDGYNLSSDTSCSSFLTATGDLNNTSPGLDPSGLQNNGGPTPTVALLSTSPAVDAIPTAACTGVATDQRGVSRPQGFQCDMGAYELGV